MDNKTSNDDNSCIICLEENGELLENFFCSCKFKFHTKCYRDWLIKSKSRKCMVCYRDYTQETIIDFLGNLRTNDSVELSIASPYEIVPYESDIDSNIDLEDDNTIVTTNRLCCGHMPCLLIIIVTILFFFVIIVIASMGSSNYNTGG